MNNINRDYLVKVDTRTAKLTPAPKELKFFMTDVWTSNIFFELEPKESISDLINNKEPYQNANYYKLTLRVVKPNGEPKTIKAIRLEDYNLHVADLTVDFVDIPGIYKCELFIDADTVDEDGILRLERNTTEPFEYKVERSIFYDLDDIIDTKILAIEDIATVDYVNSLAVGGVSLEGYATTEQLNTKADKEHVHDEYITQDKLDESLAGYVDIDLVDFVASNSISIGRDKNSVIGQYSTAEGDRTVASGVCSHAEGFYTTASGDASHAEGGSTIASNYYAHAEGLHSKAINECSHAEGYNTLAGGRYSHAEGFETIARSNCQHVQGRYNIENINDYAHIVGNGDSEARSNAHTLDWNGNAWFAGNVFIGGDAQDFNSKKVATEEYVEDAVSRIGVGSYDDTELRDLIANKADSEHTHDEYITQAGLDEAISNIDTDINTDDLVVANSISLSRKADTTVGQYSTAVGKDVTASGWYSHAEGYMTTASNNMAHAEGQNTIASGLASHAEGVSSEATGGCSHAEGRNTTASGEGSHAEGNYTTAKGSYSHAEGHNTTADGFYGSHAEGNSTTANGNFGVHAEGCNTRAEGKNGLHAEGYYTEAIGDYGVHAEGYYTKATGSGSHAEGYGMEWYDDVSETYETEYTTASGIGSHAEGGGTTAASNYQHVQGKFNIIDSSNEYAHIVGNGTGGNSRSNAHTLDWDGNGWYKGSLYVGSTNQDNANKVLSTADINFTADGKLSVTINGVTKTFSPDN